MKILLIAGARPNFMKIAPIIRSLGDRRGAKGNENLSWKLIHTGQHYDYEMSKVFFEDFDIPEPDYFLNVGSGAHAEQTAKVMVEFEKVCLQEKPDVVIVVGDVNSTLACSITAKKLNIKVAHVEAGLRSGDMAMPEEINRIVTDSISDYLFVTEKSGIENLKKEGKGNDQIFFVGNIMIDTLYYSLDKLKERSCEGAKAGNHEGENAKGKSLDPQEGKTSNSRYAVVTLHRPSNVDNEGKLKDILTALGEISKDMNIYFPIHPRTVKNIEKFHLTYLLDNAAIRTLPPMSYLDFLALWKGAALVLTDSGGIQEETTALGVPCFTIRENTERPITIEEGTNTLVGTTRKGILDAYNNFKIDGKKSGKIPELWDGKAAQRIIKYLIGE